MPHRPRTPDEQTGSQVGLVLLLTRLSPALDRSRDCKGDRSGIVNKHTPNGGLGLGNPSVFEDDDFAAFSAELAWRT